MRSNAYCIADALCYTPSCAQPDIKFQCLQFQAINSYVQLTLFFSSPVEFFLKLRPINIHFANDIAAIVLCLLLLFLRVYTTQLSFAIIN